METKHKFLVGTALLVGAVGYLMYTSIQQTSMYYLTVDELLAKQALMADEGVRIAGRVKMGSVSREMTLDGEVFAFEIGDFVSETELGDTVPVSYRGIAPDMFKDEGGSDVIIEGTFSEGRIVARNVMTSCPSKYEAEDEAGLQGATYEGSEGRNDG